MPTEEVDLTGFPEHEKSVGKQQFAGFCDDFSNGSISNEWLTLRNGLGESLKVEEGCLRLWGNNVRLSDLGTPAFAGVRQAEHQETFRVELSDETDTGDRGYHCYNTTAFDDRLQHHCNNRFNCNNSAFARFSKRIFMQCFEYKALSKCRAFIFLHKKISPVQHEGLRSYCMLFFIYTIPHKLSV